MSGAARVTHSAVSAMPSTPSLVRLSQAQVHGRALGQADLRHHIDTGYDEIGHPR